MIIQRFCLNLLVGSFLILVFCFSECKNNTETKKEVNYIPYYMKVYEADSLYLTNNYEHSFKILDSLFKKYEPINQLGVYEIETYIKSAYLTKHFRALKPNFEKLIKNWGYDENQILNDYDDIFFKAFKKSNISSKDLENLKKVYFNNINWSLRDTLIKMDSDDQLYRGKDKGKKIMREDSVDIVHIDLLKYIFKKHGYPDYKLIGYPKYDEMVDLRIVFNHISDNLSEKDYEFFKNSLIKYIKEGKASPEELAFLVDKRNYDKNHKTVYGTFGTNDSWGDKIIKFDTIEINKNRASIGLPSIQYNKFKEKIFNSMFNQN